MNFLVLRHLPTKENLQHIYIGQSDTMIANLEQRVDFRSLNTDHPVTIYYSTLIRCRQTLSILVKQLLLVSEARIDLTLIPTDRLVERHLGDFTGRNKAEIRKEYPDAFMNGILDPYYTPPKGESFHDFFERVRNIYKMIEQINSRNQVLVCSHAHVLRALYCLNFQVDPKEKWHVLNVQHGIVRSLDELAIWHETSE